MKLFSKPNWGDLRELYNNKKLSSFKIAKIKGCVKSTVLIELEKQGIKRRHGKEAVSEETKIRFSTERKGENNPFYGKTHSDILKKKWSEERCGENHLNFGKAMPLSTRKKISETCIKKGVSVGEKNPNFQNWKSKEPYNERWTPAFRNSIRKRDNQVCMNCGVHRERLNEALHVHHVNYDKKMSIQENGIILCRHCHLLTNYNREYWQKLFQEKLSKHYGYQYSEDGKIILNLNEVKNEISQN
ncbi:MAG: NUMOD3 domain-containing DNA-binding protein [Candidatus Woesearchaeota archaeon]|jgi:hypothetical protein